MYPNGMNYHSTEYQYRLVVMETSGKVTMGRGYNSLEEVRQAMIELRMIYAKHEVSHHVGYVEA